MLFRLAALGVSVALTACTSSSSPPPEPQRVTPDRAFNFAPVALRIEGQNFLPRLTLDFDRPSRSPVNTVFTAALVGVERVQLEDVVFVDRTTLTAVAPAGLAPGVWAIEVTDPRGQTGRLEGAFTLEVFVCQPDGAPCFDDGLWCTSDVCAAGLCTHPISGDGCLIGGRCVDAGVPESSGACRVCDPLRDAGVWSPRPNGVECRAAQSACDVPEVCDGTGAPCPADAVADAGTACADDGLFCTDDVCAGGACLHPTNGAGCLISGGCIDAGVADGPAACRACDPLADAGDWSPLSPGVECRPAATSCDSPEVCDGTGAPCPADTAADAGTPCADDANDCTADVCDAVGGCAHAAVTDGLTCNDSNGCTSPDTCTAGVCGGPTTCGANLPPTPAFFTTPPAGVPTTIFTFDATPTSDESADTLLEARWNFDLGAAGDTGFDTAWQPLLTATTHTYAVAGVYTVALEVRDPALLAANTTRTLVVTAPAEVLTVTTLADEGTAGATPASPGGTGFSLREALTYANGLAGPQTIFFSSSLSGALVLGTQLTTPFSADGVTVVGWPGVVIDGAALPGMQECIVVAGANNRLVGLSFRNCTTWAVNVVGIGNSVTECTFRRGTTGGSNGVLVGGTNSVFGPHNDVADFSTTGVLVTSAAQILGNRVHANGTGIHVRQSASGSSVHRNLVWGNSGVGLLGDNNCNNLELFHNTLDGNGSHGVQLRGSGHELRNTLVTNNGGDGINAAASAFLALTHVDLFANGGAACSACTPGAGSLAVDPQYASRAADDFRLLSSSPVLNVGTPVGVDVNGVAPGDFNGAAPDLGAWESP